MSGVGRFEAFYGSFLQHPVLLWVAAGLAVALCLARRDLRSGMRRYCVALGVLSALDAWLTTSPVPGLGALPAALASAVPLAFVLAGDFRFLLVVTAGTPDGALEPTARTLAQALGLTLVVPLLSQLVVAVAAGPEADARVLYLVYELLFCALAALVSRHPRARAAPWIRRLTHFVLLYYGLWAGADIVLLATGADVGFALRVVPNLLYYGGFIAVLGRLVPAGSAKVVQTA